jgi:peptidoglycan glycosyltransferase
VKRVRVLEAVLLAGTAGFFFIGFVQIGSRALPALLAFAGIFAGLHIAVRVFAPRADPVLLPVTGILVAIGLLELTAIDVAKSQAGSGWRALGQAQVGWLATSAIGFALTLRLFRHGLAPAWRMRYTLAVFGIGGLLSPLIPGLGHTVNGARLWLRVGPASFQPGEAAKVMLVLFLAAYLSDRREVLAFARWRVGPAAIPDPRYLAPLLAMIGLALVVFVQENDLGSSLLFFVTFLAIIWIATGRPIYPVVGLILFAVGVWASLRVFGHVRVRFDAWLRPYEHARTSGFQIVQGQFAMAEGGVGGTGLGGQDAQPHLIPFGWTDLILAAVGHTFGLAGVLAVVVSYIVLLTRAFHIGLRSRDDLNALAAAGFGVVLGTQACLIAGGVTRVLPLTGVTLPFVSYGGSSLLANFVMLGCLVAVSHAESTAVAPTHERTEADV